LHRTGCCLWQPAKGSDTVLSRSQFAGSEPDSSGSAPRRSAGAGVQGANRFYRFHGRHHELSDCPRCRASCSLRRLRRKSEGTSPVPPSRIKLPVLRMESGDCARFTWATPMRCKHLNSIDKQAVATGYSRRLRHQRPEQSHLGDSVLSTRKDLPVGVAHALNPRAVRSFRGREVGQPVFCWLMRTPRWDSTAR